MIIALYQRKLFACVLCAQRCARGRKIFRLISVWFGEFSFVVVPDELDNMTFFKRHNGNALRILGRLGCDSSRVEQKELTRRRFEHKVAVLLDLPDCDYGRFVAVRLDQLFLFVLV